MHGDADDLRERLARRRTLQQVLVPVLDLPFRRRCAGDAGQGQAWRQHMLAEAGMRIFGIKGIDEQGKPLAPEAFSAPGPVAVQPVELVGSIIVSCRSLPCHSYVDPYGQEVVCAIVYFALQSIYA